MVIDVKHLKPESVSPDKGLDAELLTALGVCSLTCPEALDSVYGAMRTKFEDTAGVVIRNVIEQAIRETKVAAKKLTEWTAHSTLQSEQPGPEFSPSDVCVGLSPNECEQDKILDRKLVKFLGELPTVYAEESDYISRWEMLVASDAPSHLLGVVVTREISSEDTGRITYTLDHCFYEDTAASA